MKKSIFVLALLCASWPLVAQVSSFELVGYKPAPGQHINIENIGTPEAAQNMVSARENLVSLGNFGGYIVLRFKKACQNHPSNPYGVDFSVFGNAFAGSSEPGIVYVMLDANQNGLPDDTWYEIAGSDDMNPGTIKNYQLTYYNPNGAKNIPWKDNFGHEGELLVNSYHGQEYYPQ